MEKKNQKFDDYSISQSKLKKIMGGVGLDFASCSTTCPGGGSVSVDNVKVCSTYESNGETGITYTNHDGTTGQKLCSDEKAFGGLGGNSYT